MQSKADLRAEDGVPLTRFQKIIIGDKSKAIILKGKSKATSKLKAKASRRSRTSGKLTLMLHMPLDIICEIGSHMDPLDLLYLARSSQSLRNLFMSKSTRPIWRSCMQIMGIPESPGDITEPELVSLLFESFCQGCGAPRVKKVDYNLRVRLCPGCYSLNVRTGYKIISEFFPDLTSQHLQIIYQLCCFEKASDNGFINISELSTCRLQQQKYFVPDLTAAIHRFQLLESDPTAQETFVKFQTEIVAKICEHATAINSWNSHMSSIKADAEKVKTKSRRESILKRLQELGYSDEDISNDEEYGWYSSWENILEQPRELTERIWKSILPQLQTIITRRRESKLVYYRNLRLGDIKQRYKNFCVDWKESEGKYPVNVFKELRELPQVKEIMDRNQWIPIADDEWDEIENMIFDITQDVEGQIRDTCAAHIISVRERAGLAPILTTTGMDINDVVLRLGSSFWSPSEITDSFIPRILTYDELLDQHRAFWDSGDFTDLREPMPAMSTELPSTAYALLLSMGFSDTITMEEMTDFGRRFVCKCCDHNVKPCTKWSWNDLVAHFVYKIRDEKSISFWEKSDARHNSFDACLVESSQAESKSSTSSSTLTSGFDFMSTGFDDFVSIFGHEDPNFDFDREFEHWFSGDLGLSDLPR